MIKPPARKIKCKKCGYAKIIAPRSDVLGIWDLINECPKCGGGMKGAKLNPIDWLCVALKNASS